MGRINTNDKNEIKIEKAQDRIDVLEKQKQLELVGQFNEDVEIDPPQTRTLKPKEVDYTRKKLINKIKSKIAYSGAKKFIKKIKKSKLLQIKEINGIENLRELKSGAILTSNHFNPFDSFAMQAVYDDANLKGRKLFRVMKESNYTDFPGFFGFLMRNCNTLPLSKNNVVMAEFLRATNKLLKDGHLVLIYPEQSMWWNYRKPRPLKIGAYKIACKNNVPILPIFVTLKDSEVIGPDGFPIQEYTIHVGKPISKDENKTLNENIELMRDANFKFNKEIYEKVYNQPLKYETEEDKLPEELKKFLKK